MEFNSISNLETCHSLISQAPIGLVYYSHLLTGTLALFAGIFVFLNNRKFLAGQLLLGIAIIFFLWSIGDLITWISSDSRLTMFSWSLLGMFFSLFCVFCLYFFYVFIDGRDISLNKKIFLFALLLPVLILTPTDLNLIEFNVVDCEAVEGGYLTYYYYFIGFLVIFWMTFLAVSRYRRAEGEFKKQILLMSAGMVFLLLAFSWGNVIGSLTLDWRMTQYGLFGMPVFIGFLAYLIVKYEAFNIKLISAQVLIFALSFMIASQFLFIRTTTNRILTAVTLLFAILFGIMLIRSIKAEIKRKEELEIIGKKLARANVKLKKLDTAKSEFISIASHQLRTPLTAIRGYASMLLEGSYGNLSKEHKDVIDKIYLSGERLIALVEDLLNISRIESGRMEYVIEKFSVEEVLKEIHDTFIIRSREKNLELVLDLPREKLPLVETDRLKFREVVSNLVDNAIKYTPEGKVEVSARMVPDEKVLVSVKDTGVGVSREDAKNLFLKFSRGKEINRLNTSGTGLGLHVGKKMIESLGGRIWLESAGSGKGSTFFVEIPTKKLPD